MRHPKLDNQILLYKVLARDRLDLPIRSVVFLLRPQALGPRVHGRVFDAKAPAEFRLDFSYKLVRVWEIPPGKLVAGGLGTLPLAPISAVNKNDLPGVIETMAERLAREVAPEEAAELWTSTKILMGLRWPKELVAQLLKGVRNMKESVTYQEILEEGFEKGIEKGIERGIEKGETKGRISEARSFILRSGTRKCGPPDAVTSQRLESIDDVPILEALMDRMLDTGLTTWAELLPPTA